MSCLGSFQSKFYVEQQNVCGSNYPNSGKNKLSQILINFLDKFGKSKIVGETHEICVFI